MQHVDRWPAFEPHFTRLRETPLSPADVPAWLEAWSDIDKEVWGARAVLKVARQGDPRDGDANDAFVRFTQDVMTPYTAATHALTEKLLRLEEHEPAPDHVQMFRRFHADAALYSAENEGVLREIAPLAAGFDSIYAGMTVEVDGGQLDMTAAAERLREADRSSREQAWKAMRRCWQVERSHISQTFLRLVALRGDLARNAGLPDFRAYRWREMHRFDYTPDNCLTLHEAIESEVVPLIRELNARRRDVLGVASLRPWDLDVDTERGPALRPFSRPDELAHGMQRVLGRLDPELGVLFGRMRDGGCLDLDPVPGKPNGAEEFYRFDLDLPHISMNAMGVPNNIWTLLHEFGHATHDVLSLRRQRLTWNMGGPSEFEELAAMAMMFFGDQFVGGDGGFYSPTESARARRAELEHELRLLPSIARMDAFQHWLYTQDPSDLTPDRLDDEWDTLSLRFMPDEDWSDLEDERRAGWQEIGRFLFSVPLFYVEYALSLLGAYVLWQRSVSDPAATVERYKAALSLGNTRPLPDLYHAAGVALPFDRTAIGDSIAFVRSQI